MKLDKPKAKKEQKESHLLEFYGAGCPHCTKMKPILEQVEKEAGVAFTKLEVWNDEKNHDIMLSFSGPIEDACGGSMGVPCFYNKKTKKALCGEVEKQELLDFAKEK